MNREFWLWKNPGETIRVEICHACPFPSSFSLHGKSILLWGTNTDVMQHVVEMKGEFHGHVTPQFAATLDMDKMSLKLKMAPVRQEYELISIR